MPTKINHIGKGIKSFIEELQGVVGEVIGQGIEAQLEAEVDTWLYRGHHERRAGITRSSRAYCQRCGTQSARAFSRNGHRQRQLLTRYGVVSFWLPRVVCTCGGSVHIPFSILQPYQRLWEDLLEQISRWADLGLSLRQMQGEIGHQLKTQVGLRKLNETVQAVGSPVPLEFRSVPPIIMLDAIWVTLLDDTQAMRKDRQGRQRRVKARQKVCLLVALGLYPQSQRWGILGWHLAESESQAAWEALLLPLEQRGLYRERGLELFIHDGGSGLIAALQFLYPHIPHQRCVFHKLRNLWHSIRVPEGLSRQDARTFKRELLTAVQPIFYAADAASAVQLRDAVCHQWRTSQPDFIATLLRDWQETIAFYRVLKRFPDWNRSTLRTTSLLERINRMLRRLFRAAGSFKSPAGLCAATTRVLRPFLLI